MLTKRIGIDLGTSNCVVYLEKEGIVFNEPTVVAISLDDNSILAIGKKAKEMIGKTPENIIAKKPLKNGVIANYKITEALLRYCIQKVSGKSRLFRPEVVVGIPIGSTSVEERAVLEALYNAGAKQVYMIPNPLLAAIGSKLPIDTSSGNTIVNIGGGTTEVAVISLNGIVSASAVRIAGESFNEAIISYLRRSYGVVIGDQLAEDVKINIGSAIQVTHPKSMEIRGRDYASGLPRSAIVNSNDIAEAIKPQINNIILCIKSVLEKTPAELMSDIVDRGILITGGSALLSNMDSILTKALNVPVYVSEDALFSVAKGTGEALNHLDLLKRSVRSKL